MTRKSTKGPLRSGAEHSARWRAAAYLRLSREDGDKEESDSIGNQKELLDDYMERQEDLTPVRNYIDDGWTGTNFDRPAFEELLEDIKGGKVNCIVVKDLSRFGRNYIDVGNYLEKVFPLLDVRFISVNDRIDSYLDPQSMNNAMVPFKNVMNDEYCRDISNKVRSSLNTKRKKGKFIGSFASYGYRKDPEDHNRLLVDEEAAAVVRDIYQWFLEGMGVITIAKRLNELGVLNPTAYKRSKGLLYRHPQLDRNDTLWPDCSVRRILTNRLYTGDMVQGKNRIKSYKVQVNIQVPQEEWMVVPDTHEAVVSRETFDEAQRLFLRTARTAPGNRRVYPLSGFVRCGDCRRSMTRKLIDGPQAQYCYYVCSTFKKMNQGGCTKHSIRSDRLESAILETVRSQIELAVQFDELLTTLREQKRRANRSDRLESRLKEQERERETLVHSKADLYPDWKSGILSKEEYLLLKERLDVQLKSTEARIAALTGEIAAYRDTVQGENAFVTHFLKYRTIDKLTREVLTELVEEILVHEGGGITIRFRYQDEYLRVLDLMREYDLCLTDDRAG